MNQESPYFRNTLTAVAADPDDDYADPIAQSHSHRSLSYRPQADREQSMYPHPRRNKSYFIFEAGPVNDISQDYQGI